MSRLSNWTVTRCFFLAGLFSSPLALSGCHEDPTCESCQALGLEAYACYGGLGSAENYKGTVCATSVNAHAQCAGLATVLPPQNINRVQPAVCTYGGSSGLADGGSGSAYSCAGWDPAGQVEQTGKTSYVINGYFLEQLLQDSLGLVECDTGRLAPHPDGGYVVENLDPDDFLYLLGLRDGDRPLSINGKSVASFDAAADVLESYLQGTTVFTLVMHDTTTLQYTVFFDPT